MSQSDKTINRVLSTPAKLLQDSPLLCLDYKALQAAEILNSDECASICLKQSCPQPWRIGQREHSLRWRQGSSKIA